MITRMSTTKTNPLLSKKKKKLIPYDNYKFYAFNKNFDGSFSVQFRMLLKNYK